MCTQTIYLLSTKKVGYLQHISHINLTHIKTHTNSFKNGLMSDIFTAERCWARYNTVITFQSSWMPPHHLLKHIINCHFPSHILCTVLSTNKSFSKKTSKQHTLIICTCDNILVYQGTSAPLELCTLIKEDAERHILFLLALSTR